MVAGHDPSRDWDRHYDSMERQAHEEYRNLILATATPILANLAHLSDRISTDWKGFVNGDLAEVAIDLAVALVEKTTTYLTSE